MCRNKTERKTIYNARSHKDSPPKIRAKSLLWHIKTAREGCNFLSFANIPFALCLWGIIAVQAFAKEGLMLIVAGGLELTGNFRDQLFNNKKHEHETL